MQLIHYKQISTDRANTNCRYFLLTLLLAFSLISIPAESSANILLHKVSVSEDDILLMDARLNDKIILSSLEAYPYENTVLISIEPLFDALSLKYQIYSDRLILWKDEDQTTFVLEENASGNRNDKRSLWHTDGYFLYTDIDTLRRFFGVSFETNRYQLRLNIKTQDNGYLFPIQRIAILEKQRILAAAIQHKEKQEKQAPPITVEDQYQFITMPNGRVSTSVSWDEKEHKNNYSLQLASDLLYHAANITVTKSTGKELSSRLNLSRYKTRPDKLILGAFDSYSWGDVSGSSNNLTTGTEGGLGLVFRRSPENFRRKNLTIDIEETAPPGWEAELFRNNQFITITTVPDNGQIIFEDIPTEYGNNYFQIKLYSPYGEVKIIERYYDLSTNALSEGAKAYNLFAFDKNHRVINDQSDAKREITDFGYTFDYGIYDNWQIGLGFANTENSSGEEKQFYSMKNAFALPGLLLENDVAMNDEGGYAQLTSLIGNAFGNQYFALSAESANNYSNGSVNAQDKAYGLISSSLGGPIAGPWSYSISAAYLEQGPLTNWNLTNSIFTHFGRIYLSNTLNFNHSRTKVTSNSVTQLQEIENFTGQLGITGNLLDNLRASSNINYDPRISDPILDNSFLKLEWSPKFFGINNYFTARYQPLSDSDNNWQLSHRFFLQHRKYHFTFSSSYNAVDEWSIDAGLRFFLGYDQYNNRVLFGNNTSHSSATLDMHAYLDRQANGVPDPLDYNLPGVEFIGDPDWEGLTTGDTGRAILPGVSANGPFFFGAKWKSGADTINKDYVVYAHPGARIKVNMPFYLSSEIFGFVEREGNGAPIANATVTLKGLYTDKTVTTDEDGYFEFYRLQPDQYEIRIDSDYLQQKSYTGDVVGYQVTSPLNGGFVELDVISLKRKDHEKDQLAEKVIPFQLTVNNSEALVKENDPKKRQNYFNLPVKDKLQAPYVLPEKPIESDEKQAENQVFQPELVNSSPPLTNGTSVVLPTLSFSKNAANNSLKTPSPDAGELIANRGRITIQLGAFKRKEQASNLASGFVDLPLKTEVHQSGDYYRVITGWFNTKQAANNYIDKHLRGKSVYVRQRKPEEMK